MAEVYLIMNKPKGYVCSAASDSHKTVYELLAPELQDLVKNAKRGHRLHTIGRLDADTTGLLLLTTDGRFSYQVAASSKITKTYRATLLNEVNPDQQKEYIIRASRGLTLPSEKKAPEQKSAGAQLEFLSPTLCHITLTEGKFHEVRRLFQALGNEVAELKRLSFGNYKLPQDLNPGEFRAIEK